MAASSSDENIIDMACMRLSRGIFLRNICPAWRKALWMSPRPQRSRWTRKVLTVSGRTDMDTTSFRYAYFQSPSWAL